MYIQELGSRYTCRFHTDNGEGRQASRHRQMGRWMGRCGINMMEIRQYVNGRKTCEGRRENGRILEGGREMMGSDQCGQHGSKRQ